MSEEKMGREELVKVITEAARTGETRLDLSDRGITELPEEIGQLTRLTELNLNGNQLRELPEEIGQLTSLKELHLRGNQLTKLPKEVGQLTSLTRLDLDGNQLTELPKEIWQLTSLKELLLDRIQLTEVPKEIGQLTSLTRLDLDGNQLTELPKEICQLTSLTTLWVQNNQLTELPKEIGQLTNLKRLGLFNNSIEDVGVLCGMKGLEAVDLDHNEIRAIPREILDLGLEFVWTEEGVGAGIGLHGNPLESPPAEIVKQGTEAVRRYFEGLEVEGERPLNEVKVLLVGHGGSGKTSLVKRLRENKHNRNEAETHGINIDDWEIKAGGKEIRVHFWDFGGQDIMHATHQFFLSKRSLYVLVLDGRKDEDAEYWLKHIESFGGDSPILVVINKIDENAAFDVNRPLLREKYEGIRGFCRVSCRKGEGIEEFAKVLKAEVSKVEMMETVWPKSWFAVKKRLERMKEEKKEFISRDEYEALCGEAKVEDEETQGVLVQYLNDLGVVAHFGDMSLEDMHVLDPRWLTGAVYKIVNSAELAKSKGVLELGMLRRILRKKPGEDYSYPQNRHSFIIALMKKFELCYDIDGDTVLLPDQQDEMRPEFRFDRKDSLRFYFEYDFLPRSVMPRFIVQSNKDIDRDLRWRTGVVLRNRKLRARALVMADVRARKIFIYVTGEQRRDYFAHIRQRFHGINESFEQLEVTEWVPLPDVEDEAVNYEDLIGHELARRDEIFIGRLRRGYGVADLLNGIEHEEARRARYEMKEKDVRGRKHGGRDTYYVQTDKAVFGGQTNMTADKIIKMGDGNTINAPVFIADDMENCFNTVERSGANDEIKAALKELLEAVTEAAKGVEEKRAKAMVQDAELLTKAVASEEPNRRWYECSVDGLREAAEAVGKVGVPILTAVAKLGSLVAGMFG